MREGKIGVYSDFNLVPVPDSVSFGTIFKYSGDGKTYIKTADGISLPLKGKSFSKDYQTVSVAAADATNTQAIEVDFLPTLVLVTVIASADGIGGSIGRSNGTQQSCLFSITATGGATTVSGVSSTACGKTRDADSLGDGWDFTIGNFTDEGFDLTSTKSAAGVDCTVIMDILG